MLWFWTVPSSELRHQEKQKTCPGRTCSTHRQCLFYSSHTSQHVCNDIHLSTEIKSQMGLWVYLAVTNNRLSPFAQEKRGQPQNLAQDSICQIRNWKGSVMKSNECEWKTKWNHVGGSHGVCQERLVHVRGPAALQTICRSLTMIALFGGSEITPAGVHLHPMQQTNTHTGRQYSAPAQL